MRISTSAGWILGSAAFAAFLVSTSGCTQPSTTKIVADDSPAQQDDSTASDAPATRKFADDESTAPAADESSTADEPSVGEPRLHEVAKPVIGEYAAGVPAVLLSSGHSKLCKINVGDEFPALSLPKLGGGDAKLEAMLGSKATVVVLWTDDRWMSATALRDLVQEKLGEGVSVIGVAVGVNADEAEKLVAETSAKFPQLLDSEDATAALVGTGAMPRLYVLDGQRRVAWFDIEYSEATHRELGQTLAALAK